MNRKLLRVTIDILMFFALCFLIGSGLLIHYRLLPGYRGGHGMTLFGMSRHDWGNLHLYLSFFLIALTLAHLILNYAFIKNAIAGGRRTTVVLLALVGIILISVLLLWPVEQRDTAEHHGRGNRNQRESTQRFR